MSGKRALLILGAGQYGHLAKEIAAAMNIFEKIEFLDDNSADAVGALSDYETCAKHYTDAVVAMGNPQLRLFWLEKLATVYHIPSLIHPGSWVSPSATVSPGCIVEPMAVIQTEAVLGTGCLIGAGAVINHNAIVAQGCHVDCNATVAARVEVAAGTKIPCGQVVKQ